jgi:low affinity Fe/Cu permease
LFAFASIVVWLLTGPLFHYSDSWQLIVNTATTVVTFLMVFLIQNTQNREMKALQLKLDELLRGVKGARTSLVNLEELTDEQLDKLKDEFRVISERRQKPKLHPNHQQHSKQPASA